jgi:membrane-associated phospholipid phosphatase
MYVADGRGYPPDVTDARWVDDDVLSAVDGEPYAPPDPVLTAITAAARGGGLWWAICAGLAVRRGAARTAAAQGAASVAAALVTAQLLKRVLPYRQRPPADGSAARHALPERPTSSSMPSAHAATGAAFVTSLLLENRALGVAVFPVFVAAAYGRLRTRVHWPSDVLVGAVVGAVAAGAVRAVWRHSDAGQVTWSARTS